jgi:hypothetical protein
VTSGDIVKERLNIDGEKKARAEAQRSGGAENEI